MSFADEEDKDEHEGDKDEHDGDKDECEGDKDEHEGDKDEYEIEDLAKDKEEKVDKVPVPKDENKNKDEKSNSEEENGMKNLCGCTFPSMCHTHFQMMSLRRHTMTRMTWERA